MQVNDNSLPKRVKLRKFPVPYQPARPGGTQRRVTNARGDFSSFSLPSAGMFLSNVVENIKLEGVEPQSASPKNWNSRPLHLLLDAAYHPASRAA